MSVKYDRYNNVNYPVQKLCLSNGQHQMKGASVTNPVIFLRFDVIAICKTEIIISQSNIDIFVNVILLL